MNEIAEHSTQAASAKTPPASEEREERHATVLQVLPALGAQGGVERGTVEIASAIAAAGGRALVASAGGVLEHELAKAGAEHFTLPVDSKNPWVIRANIGRLANLIRKEGVDIVHARSRAPAWSSFFAAKLTRTHFVTTFHGTYGSANWAKRWYNGIMTRGERMIAISEFIAGHARRLYGVKPAKIRIIHRGVDLNRFDPQLIAPQRVVALSREWALSDGAPIIMLPGRLTRWKGQIVLIEAMAKLGRRDVFCLLVGGDQGRVEYRREIEKLIVSKGLGGVVRIIDNCQDMPAAYMLADVVVSASTDPEAFGRVAVEAQALGRPVIASDHGGSRETVIPGETGWLTKPSDPDDLARAIGEALGLSASERQRFSDRGVDNARRNFSTEAMCAKTLAVYDEVLNSRMAG